ncbi:hypothetical protein [Arthrobacter alpinus]|uniref:hypothetical protein n=1 Tax=Arthrobacter alpinus TaxID=656366 RepID=UPI000A94B3F0|nr:hypothetical protein [Arthrobacter alpinus]
MGTTGKSGQGKAPVPKPARTTPQTSRPTTKSATPRISAKVLRRRRLAAAVLALLVIGGLVAGGIYLVGLLGGDAKNDAGTSPGASSSPAAAKEAAKPGTAPSAVCDEAGIKVVAAVDKTSYGPEEQPVLTLRVTNSGKAPCDINVGTSQMEYQITSGDDIIYNSKNCQLEPTDLVKNLAPGASETANMVWKVKRNAPDCAAVVSSPGRGGATYSLVAILGKWSSEKVTFTLQ